MDEIRRRVRRGQWIALRQGIYVDAATVDRANRRACHAVDVAGALLSYEATWWGDACPHGCAPGCAGHAGCGHRGCAQPTGPRLVDLVDGDSAAAGAPCRLVAGHLSAALLWELPAPEPRPPARPRAQGGTAGAPVLLGPGTVELVNRDRDRRTSRFGARLRPATLPEAHIDRVGVLPVTSRARTAVDVARRGRWWEAVAISDAALRAGTPREELEAAARLCLSWPGGRQAQRAIAFADGRAESVAESLARVVLAELGFPVPELQVWITDALGLIVRVDLLFRRWLTVLEIDGKVKYTDPWRAGDVRWEEKLREDRIRAANYEVVRTNWTELTDRPQRLAERLRAAFELADRRR